MSDWEFEGGSDSQGMGGQEGDIAYPEPFADPEKLRAIRQDYRWTGQCQRAFLEELAATGSVRAAAAHVNKSPRGAYMLRFRRDGVAFRLGWEAAIIVAHEVFASILMDRAIHGHRETSVRDEDGRWLRDKIDHRLSMGMLHRMDKREERELAAGSRDARAQMVAQDFENFLDLIENGGQGAEAALFFAAREGDADMLASYAEKHAIGCELAQFSADEREEKVPEYLMEEEPEQAAGRMDVWWNEKHQRYMTNYPLADEDRIEDEEELDVEDDEEVREWGSFGHRSYYRTLTPAEAAAHKADIVRQLTPWLEAGAKARAARFGAVAG